MIAVCQRAMMREKEREVRPLTAERYEAISGRRGAVAVRAGENISLKEALGQWTVTELRALASANSVKSPSRLRKEPLIDAVASALLERDRMR